MNKRGELLAVDERPLGPQGDSISLHTDIKSWFLTVDQPSVSDILPLFRTKASSTCNVPPHFTLHGRLILLLPTGTVLEYCAPNTGSFHSTLPPDIAFSHRHRVGTLRPEYRFISLYTAAWYCFFPQAPCWNIAPRIQVHFTLHCRLILLLPTGTVSEHYTPNAASFAMKYCQWNFHVLFMFVFLQTSLFTKFINLENKNAYE